MTPPPPRIHIGTLAQCSGGVGKLFGGFYPQGGYTVPHTHTTHTDFHSYKLTVNVYNLPFYHERRNKTPFFGTFFTSNITSHIRKPLVNYATFKTAVNHDAPTYGFRDISFSFKLDSHILTSFLPFPIYNFFAKIPTGNCLLDRALCTRPLPTAEM